MNKKVIILILLFLVIGGIVIFFLIKKSKSKSLTKIGKITESMVRPGEIKIGKTYKGGGMFG